MKGDVKNNFSPSRDGKHFLIPDIEPFLMLPADPAYRMQNSRCICVRRRLAVNSRNQVPVRLCKHVGGLADHGPIRDLKA